MPETSYHICVDLDRLEQDLFSGKPKISQYLMNEDGSRASPLQVAEAIKAARAKGYKVLPPCDNVTAEGHCAGHPVPPRTLEDHDESHPSPRLEKPGGMGDG